MSALAKLRKKALDEEDDDFNNYVDKWEEEAISGKAKKNFDKFIATEWNPTMKRIKELNEKIKPLQDKIDRLKELKKTRKNLYLTKEQITLPDAILRERKVLSFTLESLKQKREYLFLRRGTQGIEKILDVWISSGDYETD
jgi:uncharacterized small protein (DUF1192 family)